MSARELDSNGWMEIKDNPISKVGVFPYRGSMIDPSGEIGLDPEGVYQVYRSAKELSDPKTIDSFKLLPWVDDHLMLGENFEPAEGKGIEGVIGENVYFEDPFLRANIKLFSDTQAEKVEDGKTELSCGYRCDYELKEGTFGDQKYGVVQTKIRGNHLASVDEGRMGSDVAVLDHLTFAVDTKDFEIMPDDQKKTLDEYARDGVGEGEYGDALQMIASELMEMRGGGEDEDKDEKAAEDMDDKDRDLGQDEDEDEDKKTEDADDPDDEKTEDADEDEDKESGAMDALDAKVQGLQKELRQQKRSGVKAVMREIRKRDALYAKVSPTLGTFDYAEKTLDELAAYACDKLGLKAPKGQETTAIDAYFVDRVASPLFGTDSALFKTDSAKKTNGAVNKYFGTESI